MYKSLESSKNWMRILCLYFKEKNAQPALMTLSIFSLAQTFGDSFYSDVWHRFCQAGNV